MHRTYKPALTVLLFLLLFTNVKAESLTATYEAEWNGLTIGSMAISSKNIGTANENKYEYKVILDSEGLLKTFTHYRSENTAKGKIINGKPQPENYFTQWWRKKKEHQQINVVYKDGGKIVEETATPPEKRFKRPLVEPKDKNNTLDPVSAAFFAQSKIKDIVATNPTYPQKFTMPVFDARRRFDVEITIKGYKQKKYQGQIQEYLEVVFSRTPITGFNEKELIRMEQQDPTITFYLNADYIPVFGTGVAPFGNANFRLVSITKQ